MEHTPLDPSASMEPSQDEEHAEPSLTNQDLQYIRGVKDGVTAVLLSL